MVKSRLVQLLKSLSSSELNRFEEFIFSPFFNKNKIVKSLFDCLKKHSPDYLSGCSKHEIFSKLFPGEQYNDEKIRNVMSDLFNLSKKFIIYINFEKDPFNSKKHLLKELHIRGLDRIFKGELEKSSVLLDSSHVKNEKYYFKQFVFNSINRINIEYKISKGEIATYFNELNSEMELFINYVLIKMLEYYSLIAAEERRMNVKLEKHLYNEIMEYLNINIDKYKNVPAIPIFYNLLLLNENLDEEKHFARLQLILEKNPGFEYKNDFKIAHHYLHNYCNLKCSGMESEFSPTCFKMMQNLITKNKFPIDNQYISDNTYICLISAGLEANELSWVENFADNFKDKLPPSGKENAYLYSKAQIDFYNHNYKSSLGILSKIKCSNFYYYIRTYNLMLKCYFELGDSDVVLSLISSFKKYLDRNKNIPEYIKEKYYNFIKYVNNLCTVSETGNDLLDNGFSLKQLQSNNVENKNWLLEKIAELNCLIKGAGQTAPL